MSRVNNRGMSLLNRQGFTETWGNRFWDHPLVMRNVMCQDGVRRSVRLNQSPDTYFSWPGRVSFGKATLRGFVSMNDEGREPEFTIFEDQWMKFISRK